MRFRSRTRTTKAWTCLIADGRWPELARVESRRATHTDETVVQQNTNMVVGCRLNPRGSQEQEVEGYLCVLQEIFLRR